MNKNILDELLGGKIFAVAVDNPEENTVDFLPKTLTGDELVARAYYKNVISNSYCSERVFLFELSAIDWDCGFNSE